jgi:hypothetical protein
VIARVVNVALRGNGPSWSLSAIVGVDSAAASAAAQTAAASLAVFMGFSSLWRLACRDFPALSTCEPSVYSAHAGNPRVLVAAAVSAD